MTCPICQSRLLESEFGIECHNAACRFTMPARKPRWWEFWK